MEDGAKFKGKIDMGEEAAKVSAVPKESVKVGPVGTKKPTSEVGQAIKASVS